MTIRRNGISVGLAATVGCLWAIPYLTSIGAGIAWFIPGLLLLIAGARTRLSPFQMGFISGLYFHLTALHWLLFIPVKVGAVIGWLSLSAYCALYPALWCFFCWRMLSASSQPKTQTSDISHLFRRLAAMNWAQRQIWAIVGATSWTAMEMLQSHLLTGFPWNLLGISQIDLLPLIQLASVTGVYGVSFMVAWISLTLLLAIGQIASQPGQPLFWSRELLPAGTILVLVTTLGFQHIQTSPASEDEPPRLIRLALIQPSVDQTVIWEGSEPEERFEELIRLSTDSLEHNPDLLVWPESALPSSLTSPERVSQFIKRHKIPLVFNEIDVSPPKPDGTRKMFNAAFLMNDQGVVIDHAHKHRLVMFGEYTPLAETFPFLSKLSPIGQGFSSGKKPGILQLDSPDLKMGTLICFEDAFPALAREVARQKPDFIINLTNDAWFGQSQAQWQHARAARGGGG
ncbi:MAG: apolipoprotein N-acyltransferase, partial [Verrucomicrobia bacterium]|nr:apolipoprotein N-acyltransferase [Verrucomicrobiota bacterium]